MKGRAYLALKDKGVKMSGDITRHGITENETKMKSKCSLAK